MQRRDFLKMAGVAAGSSRLVGQQPQSFLAPAGSQDVAKTEFTLEIAPVTVELAPNRILSTVGYNGTSPGPRLRMKEGVPVTVNVVNNTDVPELSLIHIFRGGVVNQAGNDAIHAGGRGRIDAGSGLSLIHI